MEALNALPVSSTPRASSAIPDIRGFIGMVLDRGFAYQAGGAVYFDVSQVRLVRLDQPLHRRRDARARPRARRQRRRPAQAPPARLRAVASVGGRRAVVGHDVGPGPAGLAHRVLARWRCASSARRSTCTAAAADLIFPHHECERAQSEAATGEPFVTHWMHTAHGLHGRRTRCRRASATWCSSTSCARSGTRGRSAWRSSSTTTAREWEWDDDADAAQRRTPRASWCAARPRRARLLDDVRAALDDDLDTPGALAAIDAAAAAGHGVRRRSGAARRRPLTDADHAMFMLQSPCTREHTASTVAAYRWPL